MAFSEYPTQLPLDRFARIVGLHPWHFNQLRIPASLSERVIGCTDVIYQNRFQSPGGVPGRNDIARAIYEAEQTLENFLRFSLTRVWTVDEVIPARDRPLRLEHGYFIEPAVRASTLIEADASIDTLDVDGDTYPETASVTVTLDAPTLAAYSSLEEFRVFYPEKAGDPLWEIRPVATSLDVNQLTLTFSRSQIVNPDIVEAMVPSSLDPEDSVTFLSSVDVYRVYSDTDIETALKKTCRSCATTVSISTANARVWSSQISLGIVGVSGSYCAETDVCPCWNPHETLSYSAGWPKSSFTRMDPRYEKAVVALALADLGGICSCKNVSSLATDYATDLTFQHSTQDEGHGESTSWRQIPSVTKNPLGKTQGAKVAWDIIAPDILPETGNEYIHDHYRHSLGSRLGW